MPLWFRQGLHHISLQTIFFKQLQAFDYQFQFKSNKINNMRKLRSQMAEHR